MAKIAYVYLHRGLADWEPAFVLPYLREAGYQVLSIAETLEPKMTLGGLRVLPDITLKEARWKEAELLILPGGESWQTPGENDSLLALTRELINGRQLVVAAICAATVGLAQVGAFESRKHTSSFLEFLMHHAPNYKGIENYQTHSLAIVDDNLITAAGHGALEFSFEILKKLRVYDESKAREWFDFFKSAKVPATWIP